MTDKIRSPFYVIVRFELSQGQLDTLVPLIQEFFAKEVKQTPGFISARIHTNEEGTLLINYATWKSQDAFQTFFKDVAMTSQTSKKIQAFHPTTDRVFEIPL